MKKLRNAIKSWFIRKYDLLFYISFSYRDRWGKRRVCRLSPDKIGQFYSDPMTYAMGVDVGEFVNDWRKKDLRDGCPYCRREVLENASEPDVLARWEINR